MIPVETQLRQLCVLWYPEWTDVCMHVLHLPLTVIKTSIVNDNKNFYIPK